MTLLSDVTVDSASAAADVASNNIPLAASTSFSMRIVLLLLDERMEVIHLSVERVCLGLGGISFGTGVSVGF
eukprot:CCRYP_005892-RA/>CCRYP_005892-RA protein AED:0.46 eAED:0.58 QI:240/0/0.5/1/0/0/2/0/71